MIVENKRKKYATDLTDEQWAIIEPLMWKSGNKSKWTKRELINAVLYLVDSGCKWRQLPHDFPPYTTVLNFYRKAIVAEKIFRKKFRRKNRSDRVSLNVACRLESRKIMRAD